MNKEPKIEKCHACGTEFYPEGLHNLYCEKCREREERKFKKQIMNCSDYSFEKLANAVILQTCKEYVKLIKKWHKAYDAEKKKELYNELKLESKYFSSDDFEFWSNKYEGKGLQHQLHKNTYLEIKEKRLKEKKKAERKKKHEI